MSEVKVREFWIDPDSDDDDMSTFIAFRRHPRQGDLEWQESLVHVIERSYATRLEEENKKLKNALRFYAYNKHWHGGVGLENCILRDSGTVARKALSGETKE